LGTFDIAIRLVIFLLCLCQYKNKQFAILKAVQAPATYLNERGEIKMRNYAIRQLQEKMKKKIKRKLIKKQKLAINKHFNRSSHSKTIRVLQKNRKNSSKKPKVSE
jgi:hypothetical protein